MHRFRVEEHMQVCNKLYTHYNEMACKVLYFRNLLHEN